jgi:hypothetical protein
MIWPTVTAGSRFPGLSRQPLFFLPLYVFCGDKLLAAYLRAGDSDNARHSWENLSLLVKRIWQAWPKVHNICQGDSGFCRDQMLSWCERLGVSYMVGIAKNSRINELAPSWIELAAIGLNLTGQKHAFPMSLTMRPLSGSAPAG